MGYRHRKEDILAGAVDAALAHGLNRISFGRVAKHLGVSDRMVVYYFPTKEALITEVLVALGARVQDAVLAAFPEGPQDPHRLVRAAWPTLTEPRFAPVFAVFFEALGLAAGGHEPYRTVASAQIEGWAAWLAPRFPGPPEAQSASALATLALVDGLMLLRHVAGSDAADRAASALGLRPGDPSAP